MSMNKRLNKYMVFYPQNGILDKCKNIITAVYSCMDNPEVTLHEQKLVTKVCLPNDSSKSKSIIEQQIFDSSYRIVVPLRHKKYFL